MGLLKHLLFWPVTGPMFLTEFSLGKVDEVVRGQLTDDQPIKEELLELQLLLESGEIDDDEYVEREARLMAALRDVRHWREEFGMGISGGPVRVAGSGSAPGASDEREAEAEREPKALSGDARFDIERNFDE
ncbi:MAG TPA: gas vesicle protein GvpG [Longimicrobiales bacterium]|nr:gas vesicle protein GvpG [Longimicrobiales bacterium]